MKLLRWVSVELSLKKRKDKIKKKKKRKKVGHVLWFPNKRNTWIMARRLKVYFWTEK